MNRPEENLQRTVVEYLHILERQGMLYFFAVPNGGKRTKAEAGIMKATGQRAGVADIVVMFPGGRCGFIEIKSERGRLSPAQKDFRDLCRDMGFPWAECRTLDAVIGVIDAWRIGTHRGVEAA